MIDTHMFWAYGNLTKLEIDCMNSFLRLGYYLNVWSYGDMPNIALGARVRDAREIIPESEIFLNRSGSYAGFSDLFRYALLSKHGGLWVDTDVVALIKAADLPMHKFLVTERTKENAAVKLNGNVICNPEPSKGDLIDLALAYSSRFRKENISWSEIGPDLLTAIISIYPDHGFEIKQPDFANPIDHWDCPSSLLAPDCEFKSNSAFVHLYNDMWKRNGVDKNSAYPKRSLLDLLFNSNVILDATSASNSSSAQIHTTKALIYFDDNRAADNNKRGPHLLFRFVAELFLTIGRVFRVKSLSSIGEWLWGLLMVSRRL